MTSVTQAVKIDAAPEKVEQIYRKLEAYPGFVNAISSVKERDGGLLDCCLKVAGFEFPYTVQFEHVGPGEYQWQTVSGSISHHGRARVEPEGNHSLATLEVHYAPPGGDWVGRVSNWTGLVDLGLRYALESFKAHVEAS